MANDTQINICELSAPARQCQAWQAGVIGERLAFYPQMVRG